MHGLDGHICLIIIGESDKPETARLPRLTIGDQLAVLHLSELTENIAHIILSRAVRQISNIETLHSSFPLLIV
jgi:hypothetical protein